jgi:hypothetical protein
VPAQQRSPVICRLLSMSSHTDFDYGQTSHTDFDYGQTSHTDFDWEYWMHDISINEQHYIDKSTSSETRTQKYIELQIIYQFKKF